MTTVAILSVFVVLFLAGAYVGFCLGYVLLAWHRRFEAWLPQWIKRRWPTPESKGVE